MSVRKVMVLAGNRIRLEEVRRGLELGGFQVEACQDLLESADSLRRGGAGVLLLGAGLGEDEGPDAVRYLRRLVGGCLPPVVLLGDGPDLELERRARGVGAIGVLTGSRVQTLAEDLKRIVRRLVGTGRGGGALRPTTTSAPPPPPSTTPRLGA